MDIKKEYERWLENATADANVAAELKTLDNAKIEDAFYRDLAFGTGGLRGVIGAGTNRMNIYTVAKASQGLADYLKKNFAEPSVAIGYDSRIEHYKNQINFANSDTVNETGKTQEDVEANAFAGLLLMPDQLLSNQINLFGIDKDDMDTDSVLSLMDMFAIPYKATVLRLYESNCIKRHKAEELFCVTAEDVEKRVELTGKAKRWQLDGSGTESFGTLLEKADYNTEHDYLTESREKEDWKYISELKKELGMD